ncbi:glycosyltransferase family 4 protein [Agrobacterium larrymoorei]|uniref:glycosyltransferase family 4 protein n=1 Tax=Agrobacterium larrymoorei TaxID=160699 RepID=UPI001574C7E0|nr:glycosyltransferase family 4 protein [Agrobacterium larrymoorei]NTJ43923.1 glycosyltransferase family 4 protein [Agrobacterium larrymoorei]
MSGDLFFAYPGDLDLKTGGYGYDRKIIEGLRSLGWNVTLIPLGDGFPLPDANVLQKAGELLSALPDRSLVIIDGLAFGVMDEWAQTEADRLRIIALVHHPLALETGLSEAEQARLRRSEISALKSVRHTIVTSASTAAELLAHYQLNEADVTVAPPGTSKTTGARNSTTATPQILSVGSLTKRKGHDILIAALATIADLEWQATIVGSPDLDPTTANELKQQICDLGLGTRLTLAGEISDVGQFFAKADVFALASRYEGYGMVFAEALVHGLPIVACRAGAVPDVVPAGAGMLVAVDDVDAFASALRKLLTDRDYRHKCSQASRAAGARLPDWEDTSLIISQALSNLS